MAKNPVIMDTKYPELALELIARFFGTSQVVDHFLVVGGTSGIGLALAQALSDAGHCVTVASRSSDNLEKAKTQLPNLHTAFQLDASDENSAKAFFERSQEFDHLICTIKPKIAKKPFPEIETNAAKKAFDTKYWGQYFLAKYGAKKIRKSITLTSGIASQKAFAGYSSISGLNAAVEGLTRALAFELNPIRVNAVCPGFVHHSDSPPKNHIAMSQVVKQYITFINSNTSGAIGVVDGGALSFENNEL